MRRRAARRGHAAALALSGVQVRVEGLEHLPERPPDALPHTSAVLVVANHASYVDSILLTAVLPPRFGYAAMRELAGAALLGAPLRRLGAVFVERGDAAGGVEDTAVLEAHAARRRTAGDLPEGTFRRAPGLLPFKLGAFVVAAHTGRRIIPVTLAGTRSLLRDGEWLPRRCEIVITVGAPIVSAEHDWDAALALRAAARSAILASVAEPDAEIARHAAGTLAGV